MIDQPIKLMRRISAALVFLIVEFAPCTADAQEIPVARKDLLPWPTVERYTSAHKLPATDSHQERPDSSLARAIARAKAKSLVESGTDASKKALIDCQAETSSTLTMPFGTSESQQAHCFRF